MTKTPPTPVLLRQAAGIEKGAQNPRRETVATVTKAQVKEIAETKMPDLNAIDLDGAMAQVAGHRPLDGHRSQRLVRNTRRWEDLAHRSGAPRELDETKPNRPDTTGTPRRVDRRKGAHMPGKKYTDASRRYDRERLHEPQEAFDLVKQLSNRNFDETVEASFRLGVDPRKADQMLRGTVSLPSGTGKDVRVAVFAAGDAAREAEEAGADVVGTDDLVDRIQKGFVDFDVAIATPDLMGQVGKLGRVLGPRGLMPNPKTGTVTNDVGKTVADFKGGKVEYRTDRYGNVQVPLGKVSFPVESLVKNYGAVLDEIVRAKPAAAKGRYLKGITTSSTMGPGIKISPESRVEVRLTLAHAKPKRIRSVRKRRLSHGSLVLRNGSASPSR